MIKLNRLNKYYNKGKQNELHVINNISLELPDKGLICVLGESGSGKTTLVNVIGGIDDFKSGTIEAYDNSFNKCGSRANEKIRNSNYGYIFQNYYLLGEQTVKDNIEIVLNMFDISDEEKESRIDSVLEAVGMLKYKKRIVSQLSGGQQQRVAIARALVKSPKAIFADEPTGNLDEANTMNVMSILKKISQDCLIVLVTHEKRLADFYADRIINVFDGKIVSDVDINAEGRVYKYSEDANIYLKEYNKTSCENDIVQTNYYTNDNNKKVNINIVYENGKLYIDSSDDTEIVVLSGAGEGCIIDDYRPEIKSEDAQNINYSLSSIEQTNLPGLTVKQLIRLVFNNIKMLGKKQIFLVASLIIMSVLMVITVQDILTIARLDIKSFAKNDSHYIEIEIKREEGSAQSNDSYNELFNEFYDDVISSNKDIEVFPFASRTLDYRYSGIRQIEDIQSYIMGFNFVSLDHLDESTILYGKMPEKPNEMVIDVQVAEKFIENNKMLNVVFQGPRSLINKSFKNGKKLLPYTIVGICETNEASIYVDKFTLLGMVGWCNQPSSLSMLQANYPGQFDDIVINSEEALTKNETINVGAKYDIGYFRDLLCVGKVPSDYPAMFVVDDSQYDRLLKDIVWYSKNFKIYTNDKEAVMNYLTNELQTKYDGKIQIVITDNYAKDLAYYKYLKSVKLNAKTIITATVIAICMIVLYYTMKSNAMKNIKNIAVYRLLGIKKSSILLMYIFENIIVSTYTSLIGVLATTAVIKFMVSIPSLQMSVYYPWYAVVGVIFALYTVNVIIGCIPVLNIIKLPPAQITAKYDM